MAPDQGKQEPPREPRGLGEHTRGLSGEYAHEQGWGLDVEERTKTPSGPQNTFGGNDYDYGARDFGDEPVNTAIAPQTAPPTAHETQNNLEDRNEDRNKDEV